MAVECRNFYYEAILFIFIFIWPWTSLKSLITVFSTFILVKTLKLFGPLVPPLAGIGESCLMVSSLDQSEAPPALFSTTTMKSTPLVEFDWDLHDWSCLWQLSSPSETNFPPPKRGWSVIGEDRPSLSLWYHRQLYCRAWKHCFDDRRLLFRRSLNLSQCKDRRLILIPPWCSWSSGGSTTGNSTI